MNVHQELEIVPYSVLLVEDDLLIGQGLELGLRSRGFGLTWVDKGQGVLRLLQEHTFDTLILDLGLPDIDGIDLLKQIRQASIDIPIIVLTARDSIKNRVTGLDHGADDYVTKPVSTDELAARIRAAARRGSGRSNEILKVGRLLLNPLSKELLHDEKPVSLTPTEYLIIETLIRKEGEVVFIGTLLSMLDDIGHESTSQAIQVHVHSLRRKLGADLITTVRGSGYRLG
jgi:two-component system response regulator QseB